MAEAKPEAEADSATAAGCPEARAAGPTAAKTRRARGRPRPANAASPGGSAQAAVQCKRATERPNLVAQKRGDGNQRGSHAASACEQRPKSAAKGDFVRQPRQQSEDGADPMPTPSARAKVEIASRGLDGKSGQGQKKSKWPAGCSSSGNAHLAHGLQAKMKKMAEAM
jgi:hypothetical protein